MKQKCASCGRLVDFGTYCSGCWVPVVENERRRRRRERERPRVYIDKKGTQFPLRQLPDRRSS